jgi:hypothetical protein
MDNLGDFFSSIGEEKKKKKEKTKELIGDVSLDDLFSNLKEEKSKLQKKVAKKAKEKEELLKQAQIFESFLFNETPKVKKDTQKEVKILEKGLLNLKDTSYKSIDRLMKSISKKYDITPLELHNQFKEKHGSIPDDWIKHQKEEVDTSDWRDEYVPNDVESVDIITPEPLEASEGIGSELISKEETTIDKSLQILDQLVTEEEKINESETEIARLKREMDQLRKMVNESTRIASSQGGGGEVRLEFLDDVDRDSAKVDGNVLKWDSSVGTLGKWVGSNSIDIAGYAHTAGISTVSQGLTGTPDISVGVITATSATFTGNVTIGGTLRTEDKVNVDSLGIVTARDGINVGYDYDGGPGVGVTINPSGGAIFSGVITATTFDGTASNAALLNSQNAAFYLNYNNFTNTPTNLSQFSNDVGFVTFTNNNQLVNGAGYITTSFTNTSQLTNDAGFITGVSTFSGDYDDLTNKPTIPTNNNQLVNGAGYITTSFTNTNQLINGAGFITNNLIGDFSVSGDISIGGTLTYEDVTNVDSIGLITARNGAVIRTGTATTALIVEGDTRVTGIITATSFVGDGSGLTNVGMDTSNVSADTLVVSGISTLGIVTGATSVQATNFYGDGSGLTNVGMDTSNVSSDTLVVTGISTLGVVTGATSIQATTYYGDGSKLTGISAGAGGTDNVSSDTIQSGIITATSQFYPPSLTSVERDGLTFNVGAFIFNETENKLQMYLGGKWKNLAFELDTYSVVGL